MTPAIAIVNPNTLAAIGLADIIQRMMPGAEIQQFSHYADLVASAESDAFFHYFVSAEEVLSGAAYFLQRQHKAIVLVYGEDVGHLPQGFHTLNVQQREEELVRSIMRLAHQSHGAHGAEPEAVRMARMGGHPGGYHDGMGHPYAFGHGPHGGHGGHGTNPAAQQGPRLTPREREVLKGVVEGLINKEIAARMGVSLATVITHRKNLTEKLGTRSVSALTIFAVTHGIVRSEEI